MKVQPSLRRFPQNHKCSTELCAALWYRIPPKPDNKFGKQEQKFIYAR